jgi:hypothetical protein
VPSSCQNGLTQRHFAVNFDDWSCALHAELTLIGVNLRVAVNSLGFGEPLSKYGGHSNQVFIARPRSVVA